MKIFQIVGEGSRGCAEAARGVIVLRRASDVVIQAGKGGEWLLEGLHLSFEFRRRLRVRGDCVADELEEELIEAPAGAVDDAADLRARHVEGLADRLERVLIALALDVGADGVEAGGQPASCYQLRSALE